MQLRHPRCRLPVCGRPPSSGDTGQIASGDHLDSRGPYTCGGWQPNRQCVVGAARIAVAAAPRCRVTASYCMTSTALLAKWGALSTFVLQNAGVILLMRYSKVASGNQSASYNSSVAVFVTELAKLPICSFLYALERRGVLAFFSSVASDIRDNWLEWLKLSLPALLYTVQNNCLFIGLTNLEAAVAQVTYQMKIFMTALFSICLLGRRLNRSQWIGLGLLVMGVLCVQGLPTKLRAKYLPAAGLAGGSSTRRVRRQKPAMSASAGGVASEGNAFVGVCAMLLASVCSSFAGVYFEMMLKTSSTSLWLRNIQLAFWSGSFAAVGIFLQLVGANLSLAPSRPACAACLVVSACGRCAGPSHRDPRSPSWLHCCDLGRRCRQRIRRHARRDHYQICRQYSAWLCAGCRDHCRCNRLVRAL